MFLILMFAAGLNGLMPLTLAQAIAQARAASPMRAASENIFTGSTEAARLAGRLPNPLVDVRVENLSGEPLLRRDVFAVIGQPLELGGKRRLRIRIAAADRDLALADLHSTDAQIALRTAQLYVQALKARGLLETQSANRGALGTLLASLRQRVAEGYAPESDLLKFETEAARMDIEIARGRLELDRSVNALSYVIGSTTAIAPAQLVEPLDVVPPTVSIEDIAARIDRHPDVAAASARVERARQVTALERARRMPDPIISAGYKRTNGFNSAVAGMSLSIPLFDRNGSTAARALGEERALSADRDSLARRLASEAITLATTAQSLAERSAQADALLLAPADAVRHAALVSFNEGRSDVLRLLDAQRVYAEVRRTILELRLDALAAALAARFALGEEMIP